MIGSGLVIMKNNRWFKLFILQCCAVTVSISQLKISAAMNQTAEEFHISINAAAGLVSFFTIAGIILALPGAFLMKRIGAKKLLALLMGCLSIGNLTGAMAERYHILMAGRVLEGVAYAMIIMTGMDLIHCWFRERDEGIAIGIFNTFAAMGNFIVFNGVLPLIERWSVRSLWWITAVLSVLNLVFVLMFISDAGEKGTENVEKDLQENNKCLRKMQNKGSLLCLGGVQMLTAFVLFGFITCYPLLFTEYYHVAAKKANFYAGLNGLFGIPACILCGVLTEKTKRPHIIAKVGVAGTLAAASTVLLLVPQTYLIHVLASAVFPGGFVMTSVFCMVPHIAGSTENIGYCSAVVNLFYYIGVFLSTPVLVKAMQENWIYVPLIMAFTALAAGMLLWACISMMRSGEEQ